ncbi:hypothetical protein PIB30_030788 [Stylosanthes scabra]|uniref:Uncharacterized protein n=1 Tax=Stylosanthes scabra TaxID=79078 RepID=A0ABU6Z8J2_9FABA|nr:hypothetical protein [Stylosanthes scabra]
MSQIDQTPRKKNLHYIRYQLAGWQTNPPFGVQLTFGAGVAWSLCLSSWLPRVTRYHWISAVTGSDLLSPGSQALVPCCHGEPPLVICTFHLTAETLWDSTH